MNTALRSSAFHLAWLRTQRHLRSITSGGPRRPTAAEAAQRAARRIAAQPELPALRLGA